jgi:hypothetical protein
LAPELRAPGACVGADARLAAEERFAVTGLFAEDRLPEDGTPAAGRAEPVR